VTWRLPTQLPISQNCHRHHPRPRHNGWARCYPRAIRTELDDAVKHRTNQYLNNRIEQDHRRVKGHYGPIAGGQELSIRCSILSKFDALQNHLHIRSGRSRNLPPNARRHRFLTHGISALRTLEAA
jgi:putative transposase